MAELDLDAIDAEYFGESSEGACRCPHVHANVQRLARELRRLREERLREGALAVEARQARHWLSRAAEALGLAEYGGAFAPAEVPAAASKLREENARLIREAYENAGQAERYDDDVSRLRKNVATAEAELAQCRVLRDRLGEAVEDLAVGGGEHLRVIHDWRRARMYEDIRGISRTPERVDGVSLPAPPAATPEVKS